MYVPIDDGGYRLKPAESFFEEQGEQSEVKANIVAKYFDAWSNVMLGAMRQFRHFDRIAYIDLFAGPGRYKDGSKSTPLMGNRSAPPSGVGATD